MDLRVNVRILPKKCSFYTKYTVVDKLRKTSQESFSFTVVDYSENSSTGLWLNYKILYFYYENIFLYC